MMTKTRQVYRCPICGNVVEVLHSGAVLSCCGQPMQLMEENATDGAYEKHVPVIQGGRIKMRSPPKVLTGNFRPSQLSFFLS